MMATILYDLDSWSSQHFPSGRVTAGVTERLLPCTKSSNMKRTLCKGILEDSNSEREAMQHVQKRSTDKTKTAVLVTEEEDDIAKYDTKMAKYSSDDKVLSTEEQRSAEYYSTVLSSSTDI